ncbi:MAG: hypothetical protein V1729_04350 [Candidatus Woesearchaeota archaeon]
MHKKKQGFFKRLIERLDKKLEKKSKKKACGCSCSNTEDGSCCK